MYYYWEWVNDMELVFEAQKRNVKLELHSPSMNGVSMLEGTQEKLLNMLFILYGPPLKRPNK
jgi:hypothetical protein